MNKSVSLLLLIYSVLICSSNNITVYANQDEKPQPFEVIYPEIGYKTVEEAVKDFEQHFKQDLKLPLRIPSLKFTHYFGRFNDLDGEMNDTLEVVFISDKSPINHYEINVRPVKHKIPFRGIRDKDIKKVFMLKNGVEAIYINNRTSNVLVFERDNLQYMLSVDKRVSNKVTPEILVQIANSIEYSTKLNEKLFN